MGEEVALPPQRSGDSLRRRGGFRAAHRKIGVAPVVEDRQQLGDVLQSSRLVERDADRVVVDLEPVKKLDRPLPLAELKSDDVLSNMSFVRMPRVAVQRVTDEQLSRVLELSGTTL